MPPRKLSIRHEVDAKPSGANTHSLTTGTHKVAQSGGPTKFERVVSGNPGGLTARGHTGKWHHGGRGVGGGKLS